MNGFIMKEKYSFLLYENADEIAAAFGNQTADRFLVDE
jgi:hypothetical protein